MNDRSAIATELKARGWTTLAVHSAFPVSGYFGFARGFDVFESFDPAINVRGEEHKWNVRKNQRRADATTDIALAELARVEGPFFLWIHYWDPHDALELPPDD